MGAGSSKVARKLPKNATAASLAAASRSGVAAAPRAPPPRVNGGQEAPSQSQMDSASSNTYEEAAATSTQDQFHHGQQPPTRTSSSSKTSSFPSPTGSGSPLDAIGDPAFAARLRQLSATVQPNPIHSPSSTVSVHPQPQLQSQHLPPSSSSSSSQFQSHQFPSRRLSPSQSQSQSQSHAQQQPPQKENIPTLLSPSFPALQSNATLTALDARKVLERKYEEEMDKFGRNDKSFQGRQFLSVQMVKDVFELRKRGASEEEIERRLGLAKGVVRGVEGGGVVRAVAQV
ncbi:hypothetical protein NEUTE1DRAFT_132537 [Neurospora tetrasperma FGSC 2508]|uniref:Helix-turn-helix domain-containing protein n=1 Tax=Neurospora tetrasperma (strain FGSC 2508 / ATCC MYA-4615 / P0657) TaxID=510951 RepID=F8N2H7_NEUT8|nr:uncharacterized protein NEUTE1DRAFT_132537 [Neurospora tetrasperma FGSC 2508]EGO51649.1 hypothetical protein NEUTE1DRAFT_132537 [Neurospora tetrasperma FGSC 2508]